MNLAQKLVRRAQRAWRSAIHPSFVPIGKHLLTTRVGMQPVVPAPPVDVIPAISEEYLTAPIAASETIPPRIFQTWKSRSDIPSNYRSWRHSFQELNPDFDIVLWDDDDNRAFVTSRFPWLLEVYNSFPKEIYRADLVRPLFLFLFGGFYADMDSECLRPLASLRGEGNVLLGRMGFDRSFEHSVPNALMGSRPFQVFWLLYIDMIVKKAEQFGRNGWRDAEPELVTGPIVLKEAVDFYLTQPDEVLERCRTILSLLPEEWQDKVEQGELNLLHPDAWYGLDWTNPMHRRLRERILSSRELLDRDTARALFPKASMITYWSHSW